MIAEHIGLHDDTIQFAMALAGLILSAVVLVQSRFASLIAWAAGVISLALVFFWWPS